jgi:hypothetical protein
MTTPDPFEKFLTQQLQDSQPYLADDGFTDGVMSKVQTQRRISRRMEYLIIALHVLAACVLVLTQLPVMQAAETLAVWALTLDLAELMMTGAYVSGAVLLMCSVWLARQTRLIG